MGFCRGSYSGMEAGGFVNDFNGNEDLFSSHHLVAGNMSCVKAINEEIKKSLI